LLVPVGHLDFTARQAEDGCPVVGAHKAPHDVVQEGVHRLGQRPVAVKEIQQLVEQ